MFAKSPRLKNVRVLFTIATHEEIGRFGSRVAAGELRPDVVIGVDVSHDLKAAPGVDAERYTPIEMGKGFSLSTGAIASEHLNGIIEVASHDAGIPLQIVPCGADTGTDAMAAALASIDAAATSLGFPIRNMHTISESAHTGDVLACIYALEATLRKMDKEGIDADTLRNGHPRLDQGKPITA